MYTVIKLIHQSTLEVQNQLKKLNLLALFDLDYLLFIVLFLSF